MSTNNVLGKWREPGDSERHETRVCSSNERVKHNEFHVFNECAINRVLRRNSQQVSIPTNAKRHI